MEDKKNIDRLFQEKFKDFEIKPNASVWNSISSEIQNAKKQSKGIPVWWRVAGIAAALMLLFTIGSQFVNNDTLMPEQETTVDIDSKNNPINNIQKTVTNKNTVAEENNSLKEEQSTSTNNNLEVTDMTSSENEKTSISKNKNSNTATAFAKEIIRDADSIKNLIKNTLITRLSQDEIQKNNTDVFDNKNLNSVNTTSENTVTQTDKENTEIEETNTNVAEEKTPILEAIAVAEEIKDPTEEEFKRWSVSSNIAPVYFNTLGKGSSIHPQFINNSKTGNINMSYGISGSYAITKKWSVRAGISKVNLGYNTNDVIVYNNIGVSTNTQFLKNVAFNEAAQNLSFISVDEFNFAQVPGVLNNFIESSIAQELGFIEIPLELQYKISNKKMGIHVIGGFSALFLNTNEVYSVLDGKSTLLGKATNINNTSFSANFGLGFDFNISKKVNFNLEPVFKYQLNTFNNTSGNFKPFFIGVYSGLRYKF